MLPFCEECLQRESWRSQGEGCCLRLPGSSGYTAALPVLAQEGHQSTFLNGGFLSALGSTLPSPSALRASSALALWPGNISHFDKLRELTSPGWFLTCPPLPREEEALDKHLVHEE